MNFEELNHEVSFYISPKGILEGVEKFLETNNIKIDLEKRSLIDLTYSTVENPNHTLTFLEDHIIEYNSNIANIIINLETKHSDIKMKKDKFETFHLSDIVAEANIIKILEVLDNYIKIENNFYNSQKCANELIDKLEQYNMKCQIMHFRKISSYFRLSDTLDNLNEDDILTAFLKSNIFVKNNFEIKTKSEYKNEIDFSIKKEKSDFFDSFEFLDKFKFYEKKAIREFAKNENILNQNEKSGFIDFDKKIKDLSLNIDQIKQLKKQLKSNIISEEIIDLYTLNTDKKIDTYIFNLVKKLENRDKNVRKI